jgi:hypothetical protein
MNVNAFLQKDYENEPPSVPKKQSQFKPNPERIEFTLSVACPESSRMGRREWANSFKGQNRLPENPATPSKARQPFCI